MAGPIPSTEKFVERATCAEVANLSSCAPLFFACGTTDLCIAIGLGDEAKEAIAVRAGFCSQLSAFPLITNH
jgi:hypothetical protein